MNGAIAQLKGGIEVLARPVDLQGVSTYTGVNLHPRRRPRDQGPRHLGKAAASPWSTG